MADPGTMSDSDDSGADSGDFIYKHKMDLRVSIFDRNPVTGAPVSILEEGKLLKVDPTMLVKDVCHLIHEKHLSRYGDKYAGALPKNHWDIFLPPDAEKIKHWGDDGERVTQGREFKDLKVEYLDWDLSLLNYTIAPDTLLWYICRDRPIQVDVFGHQTRVLIDDSWRVCDIVQEIGHKLDIGNDYEYSLKTVDDPDNPNIGWLRANKTLHEQEVQVNPYEDEHGNLVRPVLILKKKLFFENNNDDLDDDTMLHLLYRQCQQSVVQNQLPISLDEAIRLAALALYVQFGQYDKKIHKRGFVSEWRDYLPTEYADEKKVDKKVFDQLKKQSSSLASAEDPNRRAQRFYVDMCRSNTNWGWTYWRISELRNDGGRREQWTERLIGMSGEGITRLRLKDKKVMDRKEWTDVREWGEVGRRGETNPAFFIKFTDDERPVVIKPTDPAQVKILIQYVEDYLWLLRRMRDGDIDSDSDDDPVVLPAATAGTFSMGTRRRRKKKRGGDGDDDGEESPDPLEPTPPEEIPEDPQEALEPIVNTFNLNLNYDISNVLPPPTKKREQLEKMAEARAGIAEKAGAVQLMNLDMLAAVDCGDPRLMNTDLLLAAANDVAKHMQGLIGEALDAAALDPEAGDQYRALVEAVGTNTAGLMAQAQAIALAVNSGDPDAANLNDLLAAANLVGSAINDLIGLAGLPTPAADFQDELKASARLVDTKMNELAEQAGTTTFHHMISSQAALLKRQLEQMPVWSNQLVSVVDASAANLKLPLVQIKVKGRVDLLAANMDGFLDDIPDQNEDMLAAARAIRDALAAMSEGIDNIATGAATGNKVDVAYEALTAAVAKLKTEAEEPASVSAVSQDVAGAATEMCRLAQLEVSNDGAAGSHDKLLEAAQDLAAAIAALQGQVGAGDAMNIEAVRAAGSSVNDKAGDLMMERRHISLMREVAETAEEVVAAAGEVLVLFEGPAKAVNNHDDVRAVRAAKKKQQSLHGASRAYVTDPANLKYQDALVHAANQATDKLTPLVTSALAAVDNSDYQLDGNALKKAAQALSAALQDLMGVLGETKRTLWSLDVNNAQEILNEAIERLDKAASEVEAGHLVLDGEVERTQRQHLDDVVASLGAVPGLAEALSDVAIHSKNPPRLAQACRDVAYEVNGLASFATNLAAATGDLAHQQALISRAKEVCLDTKEEIRRGDFAVRNPSDAASDAAMENALAGVRGSISDLEKALPGIGDALKGIETVEAAKASLHPTGLTLDDGGMMLGGTADLASLAGLLSQALEGMIDEGDGTGLLDAPEEVEAHSGPGVQTQNPIDVFKNEITSAGRTLQAAVSRLGVAARDTPDTFSGVASRVGRISTSVIDAVASATAAPELSADKGVISGNTESVADAVIAALTACVDVSKNPDDEEATGSLAAAARAVGEAFDSLNGAFRAAAENSVGSLEDVDTAVTDINAALGGLDPLAPPPAGASIKAIQDSIIQVADAVSRAMVNLVDVAETDPDRTGDPAKALAAQAVALIQRVAVAAALVPVDGADGDGGEGASSSSGGPDPNAELKGLIEVVTSKLQALVGADPGADKARFTQAATVTVTSTQAVIAKAVEVAERMEEPVYQDALKNVAKSIKSALSKLAKVATIYAEHPEAAEAHDAMVSKIGSLAGKIDKLSRAAATISEQLGSGGSGGSGADDGDGASATTSADMRNALVGTGRELGEGLVDLLGQSKVVATDITNIASHNRLKKRLKENKKVLKALKKTAALLAPGQKECAWAITKSIEEANAITNASLDFSVGKLRAKASKPFEVYFDQLVRVADALSEAVRALAEASYTDAAAVGPAAEALGQALPALTSTVKKVAVTAADPTLGQRVLRECKEVPEAVSTFVRVCKDAGGNPVARAGVEEALAVVMVEIKEIKQVMEEDGAARLDCDAAIKAIEDAAALVDEPTELVPGLGYSDYTKRLKKTLRKTAKAVIKLVDVSSSDPSDLGAAARLIASVFPETIAAVKGNIELTGDDNTRAQIREAAGAWADGVKGLVIAAKAVQGGGSSASGVSAASDATTQALTNLLELVAAGATAKHEIQAAARRLDSAVSSLRTTEFMVTTKQISNDGGVSFADVAGRAAQALTATRDAAAQFASAGDEEALSAATQAAANAAETLLSLAELGASVLENEDDQLALLAAARSLANALGDLIVASGDAVADHEAVDGAKTAAFGESVQTMAHALAHGQEADNRAVNAMAEVSAGLDAALAQLGGPGSSTAFGAPSAAVRDLLRATQKLFFLTTKGRAAQIEFAQGLPPMVAAVAAAMTAVAYNETARGQVTSTVGLIKQLLAQIGAQAGSDDLSDATQGVSQELTALLATLRNAQLVADGADPSALFAEEMTSVTGIVSGAEATIDELIARPPDNSNDVTRNALIEAILAACKEIATGVAFVASVAASPGVEVEGDARENLIVVSRNLGSAMNELTSAASAFVSGEADETYLERAAKVVTNAVVEVIQVVQPALAEDATKRLNKAGRAVGAGYNKLLEACRSLRQDAEAGDDDDDIEELVVDDEGDMMDAESALQAKIRKRAEIARIEKKLANLKRSLA